MSVPELNDETINNSCRVCLTLQAECGLFSMNPTSKSLLSQMFNIKVDESNSWKICVPCLNSIDMAAKFKEMATKSDQHIQRYLQEKIIKNGQTTSEQQPEIEQPQKEKPKKRRIVFNAKGMKKTVQCMATECNQMFRRIQDMRRHFNIMHIVKTSPAVIDTDVITTIINDVSQRDEVIKQEPSDSNEKELPCPYCEKRFILSDLSTHLLSCTDKNVIIPVAQVKLEPEDTANLPKTLECDICKCVFETLAQLDEHKLTHVPALKRHAAIVARGTMVFHGAYRCNHCPKAFDLRGLLARHVRVVHGIQMILPKRKIIKPIKKKKIEVPLQSKIVKICCGITYMSRNGYHRHRAKYHPELVQPQSCVFFCNICHQKMNDRKELVNHYKTAHEGQRAMSRECNVCGRTYSSPDVVYKHKRTAHAELFVN